jgi:hypothetical protein
LQIIKEIDEKVEAVDLDDLEWKMRYKLERDLEIFIHVRRNLAEKM